MAQEQIRLELELQLQGLLQEQIRELQGQGQDQEPQGQGQTLGQRLSWDQVLGPGLGSHLEAATYHMSAS